MEGNGYGRPPIPPSASNESTTCGYFRTEDDAWKAFDAAVDKAGAFKTYVKVYGEYLQPRVATEIKIAEIDRILVPNQKAIDAGWNGGIIGVEGKKSGVKLGPPVSQALDYSRCAFRLANNFWVHPLWVFVFPMEKQNGPLQSLMYQNRIGTVEFSYCRSLVFSTATCTGVIHITPNGDLFAKQVEGGNKRGSR